MTKIRRILLCILAFFVLGAFLATTSLNAQDTKTLENGLKVIAKEDHRKELVAFSVFIDTGSASEGEYAGSGISHLIEHMLFKGTKKYKVGAIETILNRYGGTIEGWTSYDYTGFTITILKKHKYIALDILKEILTVPTFDKNELKKEMAVIKREMDLNNDEPGHRISQLTFSTAFIRHPYRIPIIGYKENFERLIRNDIIKFFKSQYAPEKITMAVVGDIEEEAVLNEIAASFGKIPRGKNISRFSAVEPVQLQERFREEKMDIDGAYLNISFHSTGLLDKDLYAMDLVSFILGQGESSRLNEKLRMKEQLVLSISAYNYTPKEPGLFIISSVLKEENAKKALDGILQEIDNLKNTGIEEDELTRAKNNFIAGYIYQKETIESQANDLAQSEVLTGNPDFYKQYIENIKLVTREDILSAAKKYLNRENMTVTIISKSGRALRESMKSSLQKQEEKIKKAVLINGIPVLVAENHSLPMAAISVLFKGGLLIENKDNNGLSRIVSCMLMDGTDSMKRQEISKFYETKGISISTYSGNNSLGVSAVCLKEYLEDTLKLIADLCKDSIFPEDELVREKNEQLSLIDMQDNEIFNQGHRLLKEALFKTHPYGFQTIGKRGSVNNITRDKALDFYKNILSPDNIIIGISGDCDMDEVTILVEKYFSKIPARKIDCNLPEKEPLLKEKKEVTIPTDKKQSLILIGFQGMDIYDKDKYAVEVLVDVLSSPSGMLFKSIREAKGLSYAVGAFNVLGLMPGYIAIYSLTSKENINKAKDRIFKEVALLIKNGVSEKEIEKAKEHLKAIRQIEMQTNSNFISLISMDELYGLGYNNYKAFDRNIDNVTKEDVKRVANRFLTIDRCVVLVLEGK